MTAAPATPAYAAPFALRFGLIMLMGLISMIWFVLNRIAAEGGVPFMGVAFAQCAGGAAFMAALLLIRRKRVPLSRDHLIMYAICGFLGAAVPYTSVAFASPRLPVGVLSMGLAIEPALTYLVALPLLLEKFRTVRFFGILVGIAGLMLILLPQAALPSPDMVPWVILGLCAPIGWATWNNYIVVARARDTDSNAIVFGMLVCAAVMLLPPTAATGALWWFNGPGGDVWWAVVALTILNSAGWVLGFETVKLTGPVFYSTWAFFAVPLTMLAGIVIFAESHSLWIWSALVLLLISLYLVNLTMASARRRTESS